MSVSRRAAFAFAIAAALAVRLFIVWRFTSAYVDDDGKLYLTLADNLLGHGTYGLDIDGRLTPVDIRMPGYPLFLLIERVLFGHAPQALALVQALLDTACCAVIAMLAGEIAPERVRTRVALVALWFAALCPFVAGYSVHMLTEVSAVLLTALALSALLVPGGVVAVPRSADSHRALLSAAVAGLAIGVVTLFRPETPLLAIAALFVLAVRCRRRPDWPRFVGVGVVLCIALFVPLAPWALRNATVLHEFRVVPTPSADLPGEFVPRGFEAWTHTWLTTYLQVQQVSWKMESESIDVRALPTSAFDSQTERVRVVALLREHNRTKWISPEMDATFGAIARERTSRHPLRTYLTVPLERAATMWFTPRLEWVVDDVTAPWPLVFFILNSLLIAAAIGGAWATRRRPATAFLVAFVVIRTAFLTSAETPEPRYVLECFPALLALAAQLSSIGTPGRVENTENGR